MTESNDGDFFLLLGTFTKNPWVALVLFAIAMTIYLVGVSNEMDCESRACPVAGQKAKLLDHECVCVGSAK